MPTRLLVDMLEANSENPMMLQVSDRPARK
jgi:hypothetical protein